MTDLVKSRTTQTISNNVELHKNIENAFVKKAKSMIKYMGLHTYA